MTRVVFVLASKVRAIQMLSYLPDAAEAEGVTLAVCCPDDVYAFAKEKLDARGIEHFPLPRITQKHPIALINHLRYYTLTDFKKNWILDLFRRLDFAESSFFLPKIIWPLSHVLRFLGFSRSDLWDRFEVTLFGNRRESDALFAWKPDWVVFPTPVMRPPGELAVFFSAKKRGIPTAALDEAYGQFVNQPVSMRPFDRIFVWNTLSIGQAKKYRGIPERVMEIAGPHRFDAYFRDLVPSRDAFARIHGLNPSKRWIAVVLSGVDAEFKIIDAMVERIRAGELSDTELLVRPNPFISKAAEFKERYGGAKGIVIQDPLAEVSYEGFDTIQAEMADLAGLLKWSAVIISQASTTAVEGAIFDTPHLYHMFDLNYEEPTVPIGRHARKREAERRERYDEWEFIGEILSTGAVPLARSLPELMSLLDTALSAPEALQKERAALVKKISTYTDGRSGERIMRSLTERHLPQEDVRRTIR